MRLLDESFFHSGGESKKLRTRTKDHVFDIIWHQIPSDPKRFQRANLETLRSRDGLLDDLQSNNNLLYEGTSWAISTTVGPYGNNHLMLIYTGSSREVSHLGALDPHEQDEYFELLSKLQNLFEKEFCHEVETGEIELLYGMNHSYSPGPGNSQSVHRPHTHIIAIHTLEKSDGPHTITKIPLKSEGTHTNKGMLALNEQNLSMLQDFEKMLPRDVHYYPALLLGSNEYYALDFPIPGDFSSTQTQSIFLSLHSLARSYLEHLYHTTGLWISRATYESIQGNKHKIGFSCCFHQEKNKRYLRLRFSYKNEGEQAGVLESKGHCIDRINGLDAIPDTQRVRNLIQSSFDHVDG